MNRSAYIAYPKPSRSDGEIASAALRGLLALALLLTLISITDWLL